MVLDDDVNITAAIKAYFEASGFQVDIENDPESALEKMCAQHYHILLLDFLMRPICGDEVVAKLRTFDPDISIILLTGHKEMAPPLNTLRELDIQYYYEKSERFDQLELLVESCVKSIRQMKVIQDYRDGLKRVLIASTEIHQLNPVDETLRKVLDHTNALAASNDAFVLIRPESENELSEVLSASQSALYCGDGIYNMTPEQFINQVLPNLAEACENARQSRNTVREHSMLLAPLFGEHDLLLGWMGISTSSQAVEDHLHQIFELFSKQAAAAINNTLLHALVNYKRTALNKAYHQLKDSYLETISVLRLIVDAKDIYTRGHSDRVSELSRDLALAMGKDEAFAERVRVAGLFHDVGKVGIPDSVLTKAGRLDDDEYNQMKQHPSIGARIVSTITMFSELISIVESHHEHYNGRGYPNALAGVAIPEEARMISIADAYDAMTSNRHYRTSLGDVRAKEQLISGRETQFDGAMVDTFINMLKKRGKEG